MERCIHIVDSDHQNPFSPRARQQESTSGRERASGGVRASERVRARESVRACAGVRARARVGASDRVRASEMFSVVYQKAFATSTQNTLVHIWKHILRNLKSRKCVGVS